MISLLYNDTKPLNIGGINMKCNNCGFEYEDSLRVCPNCESNSQLAVISLNPAADKVSAAITDGLFLVMCILMSASCIFGLLVGRIPTLNILFTIFMWLAYAQARKGILDSTHLRSLSGTTFAMYVINYVAAGLVALAGFMIAFVLSVLVQSPVSLEEVTSLIEIENPVISQFVTNIIIKFGGLIGFVIVIIAVLMIVINILGYNKIHKFAKSVYQSIDMNTIGFQNAKTTKIWLYIIAAYTLVSGVYNMQGTDYESLSYLISDVCTALTAIFAGVLIGKYLQEEN
jgi:hypothetical protein